MRICDFIEELVVDNLKPLDKEKNQIIATYSDREWIWAVRIMLQGLPKYHTVRGDVVGQLWNISADFQHKVELTRDQRWFILHSLIENWHQMSCESRANLLL
jgi:hypothetical protein